MGKAFSLTTILLYVFIGYFCAYWLKTIQQKKYPYSRGIMFGILWTVLTLLGGLRLVTSNGIGGADAWNYQYVFLFPQDSYLSDFEPLFQGYIYLVSSITSNPIVYRLISYGLIAGSYCIFLNKFIGPSKMSMIPFLMIIYPYLRSFNTFRTSLAIVLFTFGLLALYERKNILASILILSTIFIHRMSILYALFLPLYFIYKDFNFSTNRRVLIFLTIYVIIGYIAATKVQSYVLLAISVSERDAHYLSGSVGTSILSRIPIMFQHIMLMVTLCLLNNRLPNNRTIKFLRICVIFDIIVAPVSVVLNMWRALEYMYLPRLIMWGYLIYEAEQSVKVDARKIVTVSIFCMFAFWQFFRINQEWEPAGLSPYLLGI